MIRLIAIFAAILMAACTAYHSPARDAWPTYLRGASFTDMTEPARVAKRPVFLGAGGQLVTQIPTNNKSAEYGDKATADNMRALQYMSELESVLYDALRKPGISVQRAGTDVVVILVRDAIMELDVADISQTGADTLETIAHVLKKYDATFVEIAGYTDAIGQNAASAVSMDMAQRTGVFLAQQGISPVRMFIVARGASRPIAAQDDIGRLTNRRVELRIAPAR